MGQSSQVMTTWNSRCCRVTIFLLVLAVIFSALLVTYDTSRRSNVTRWSPECLRKVEAKTVQQFPKAVIAGFPKAGTSALQTYMSLHPDIESPSEEMKFFNNERNYEQGTAWYLDRMPHTRPDQITIEKSPNYITSPIALRRLKAFNESIRILVIVREPVQRALSHFIHNHRAPMNEAAALFEGTVLRNHKMDVNNMSGYIQKSTYITYLKVLYEQFSRQQIMVVDGDELVENPAPILREVEAFLGVGHYISSKNFYYNKMKGFLCPIDFCSNKRCLGGSKGRPHPVLEEKVVLRLNDYFRPHNKALFKLVGKDFGWPT